MENELKIKAIEEAKEKLKFSSRRERRKTERQLQKEFGDKSIHIPFGKTFSKKTPPISKAMRRALLKNKNLLEVVGNIIFKYFPQLSKMFDELTDIRNKSYIKYNMRTIIFTRLLALICGITTMYGINSTFNTEQAINNLSIICNQNLKEIPDWQTIQDVIETLNIQEIEDIRTYIVKALIRSKMFDKYRYNNYFQLVVDATGISSFDYNLNDNCLSKTRDGNTTYYKYVLEAKIVVGDIVLSIDSEWIENNNINNEKDKQDCEINAFKRMAPRIYKNFSKFKFIVSGDALYANEPMIKICEDNGWKYIFNLKKDRLKDLFSTFEGNIKTGNESTIPNYAFSSNLDYKGHTLHAFRYTQTEGDYKIFNYITNLNISNNNIQKLVILGRNRWKIENEGFNEQKNGTYCISHLCSRNENALRIHYYFIQIAHIIRQLLEFGSLVIRNMKFKTKKEVTNFITQNVTSHTLQTTLELNFQLRFDYT